MEPKKVYLSSPTRDAAAKEGLGGVVGQVLAAGVVAVVAISAASLSRGNVFEGENLSYYLDLFSQ